MDEKTLLEYAWKAADQMEFKPTPNEKPWLVKISEGFKELKQKGLSLRNDGRPATLQVVDKNYHNPADFYHQQNLASEFNKMVNGSCVKLPKFCEAYSENTENGNGFVAFLWERPIGANILSKEEFTSPLLLDQNRQLEKKIQEVVQIITDTERTLPKLVKTDAANYFPNVSVADYFIERFGKWMKQAREKGEGNGCLIQKNEILTILDRVFHKASGLIMTPSFNLFGNTDIIKDTTDGKYFLVNGRFELKPMGFLRAAWLWNLAMYSYKKTSEQARDDFRDVYGHFYRVDGVSNILERLFAASYIDARYWLSPFDGLESEERENGRNNLYLILKEWARL